MSCAGESWQKESSHITKGYFIVKEFVKIPSIGEETLEFDQNKTPGQYFSLQKTSIGS